MNRSIRVHTPAKEAVLQLVSSWWVKFLLVTLISLVLWSIVSPILVVLFELWLTSTAQQRQYLLTPLGVLVILVLQLRIALRRLYRVRHTEGSSVSLGVARLPKTGLLRDAEEMESTARHEAAHMVVSLALGLTPISVDINHVGNRFGQSQSQHPESGTMPDRALTFMVVSLAGQIINHRDGRPDGGACIDIETVMRQAATIISIGEPPSGYTRALRFDDLLDTARQISTSVIEMNETAINDLAQRLLETRGERRLDAEDLQDLQVVPCDLRQEPPMSPLH